MANGGWLRAGLLSGLAAAAAAGCGGAGDAPAAAPSLPEEVRPFGGPPTAALRVDLARAAGAVKIQRASRLTTPPPPRALGGDLVAVAWADDGTVVDAAPVSLSTTLFSAGSDDAGNFVESAEADDPDAGSGTVFLKDTPALDRIEIVDASGAVVATVRADELGPAAAGPLETAAAAVDVFHAEFPWVAVLGQADADLLPTALRGAVSGLVQPSEDHMSMFRECFTQMSEAEKLSVLTVGVATLPNQGRTNLADGQRCKVLLGKTEGSTFVINADFNGSLVNDCVGGSSKKRRFLYTCLHEGAHTFTNLVAVANTTAGWPDEVQKIAQQAVQDYDLSAGLAAQFTTMQASAVKEVALTAAKDYGAPQTSDETAVSGGFATAYGSERVVEDIAEYVAQIQGGQDLLNKQPAVCAYLAGAKKLSARTAIQYAKAVLLRGIGLIDDAQFGACMRGFGISAQPGIGDPGTDFQFTDNLDFGYFDQAGERMFGVAGDGADSAQFLLRVLVKNGQPPLGLSRLERITMAGIDAAKNGVLVANDNIFEVLTSTGGLALITEISPHTTAGVILSLDLGTLGLLTLESHPIVTFRVSK